MIKHIWAKNYRSLANVRLDLEPLTVLVGYEQCKEYHRNVWPEVLDCIRTIDIDKMNIYLLGQPMFMIMDAPDDFDPANDFVQLDGMNPRYEEWQRLMGVFQKRVPEAQLDEHWAMMERVFEL